LDLAPEERFVEVTKALKVQTDVMFDDYIRLVPRFIKNIFEDYQHDLEVLHHSDYLEITSIANILERPVSQILLLNYMYEIHEVLCTSIVASQADGTVIHGRNMDFGFPDAMRNASYVAEFYKNGKLLFQSPMFGGYLGVLSAHRPGAYSLTVNARRDAAV